MGFAWLRACLRSTPELYDTEPSYKRKECQAVIDSGGNASPVQPAGYREGIHKKEGFTTKECVTSTGTKSIACISSEADNPEAAGSGGSVVKRPATRPLTTNDSPVDTSTTRSFTAPEVGAIDLRRCNVGSAQYSFEDAEYGPMEQRQPQHQRSTPPFTYPYRHQNQPQIFVANLGALATNSAVTAALDGGSATKAITTITPIITTPLPFPNTTRSQLDTVPSAPLPPRTLLQPPTPTRQTQTLFGPVPLTRPRTAPVRRLCNSDFFHLLSPPSSGSSGPPAAPGTGVAFPPALPVDASLTIGVCSGGRRSFGTSDLQLASVQEPGSFSSAGADGGGVGGRVVIGPWTGPGPSGRTLSDMPGLDLRNSAHLMALCDSESAALNMSQTLLKNPNAGGSSSEGVAPCGSGGSGGAGGSINDKTAALAAVAAAAERELGLIRVSSLSELAGQLEGLRWLASGSSGRVFTGLWKGSPVAVKVLISATPDQLRESSREALLTRVVSHPAICQCYTVCSDCITAEHLQLTRQRAQLAATGSCHGVSSAFAVDTLGSMLPSLPQMKMNRSVQSPMAGTAATGSGGGPGGVTPANVLSAVCSVQIAADGSGAGSGGGGSGRHSLRVLYERQSFSSAAPVTVAEEDLAPLGAAPSPSESAGPSQSEDRAAGWQAPSLSEPSHAKGTANRSNGGSPIGGAVSSLRQPSSPAMCISGQEMDDGGAASHAARVDNVARIRVRQHLAQLKRRSPSSSSDHALQQPLAEESGGGSFGRRSDSSTAAATSSVKSSMVATATAAVAVAGGGGGGLTASGSADNSSRGGGGGTVSSLFGWGCGTASQVSGSSLPATSHGLATTVQWEARRCLAPGGTAQAVTDLNTTLSLSELLRSYTPGDEDNNLVMQSLPAALLSMGAMPGRFCTIVVLEWCNQGNLLQAIRTRPFNPERTPDNHSGLLMLLRTALEIAQGMRYLHSLDVVHGDLKPSNVLLQSHASTTVGNTVWAPDMRGYVAKVADFGLSMPAYQNSVGGVLGGGTGVLGGPGGEGHWGALAYMAPEVPESGPSKKSDVYSYGCVLYHMCTGKQPFQGIRQGRLLMGLTTGSLVLQWPENVYKVLRRLGEACCAANPRDRPSFDKAVDALQRIICYVARSPTPSLSSCTGHGALASCTVSTDAEAAAAVEAATAAAAAWRSAVIGFAPFGSQSRSGDPPPVQERPT